MAFLTSVVLFLGKVSGRARQDRRVNVFLLFILAWEEALQIGVKRRKLKEKEKRKDIPI